jgi:hypothetical protein
MTPAAYPDWLRVLVATTIIAGAGMLLGALFWQILPWIFS